MRNRGGSRRLAATVHGRRGCARQKDVARDTCGCLPAVDARTCTPLETVHTNVRARSARSTMLQFSWRCGVKRRPKSDAAALAREGATELPLYGIPMTIRDNVRVAGPMAAACPGDAPGS